MLNQPRHQAFELPDDETIGPGSAVRFRGLAAIFVIATLVVLLRIGWVQIKLQERYLEALEVTTIDYEVLPARDGRILTDRDVLATDLDQYSVEVFYRWLQDPVDETWLTRQVRNQLTREEARDPQIAAETRARLLQTRADLWAALQGVTGLTQDQLAQRRQTIQEKVMRIADSVNRRHFGDDVLSDDDLLRPDSEDDSWLLRMAAAVRQAVTETPARSDSQRIVVREEEDFHAVVDNAPLAVAAEIREHPERFPGVRVTTGTRRTYPRGTLASHLVGARTELRDAELKQAGSSQLPVRSATWTPRTGRFGVELSYNRRLQGTAGLRKLVRNRRQEIVEVSELRPPAAGHDVVLTIHTELQAFAEAVLQEALGDAPPRLLKSAAADDPDQAAEPQVIPVGGSVVVMEIQTGRLLAAASAPGFDLSLFTSGTQADWDQLNEDQRRPFVSRVTGMALPPGSVFKPVVAAAAMESGQLDPDAVFDCQGYLSNPNEHRCLIYRLYGRGHNQLTLRRALAESCNVYFFEIARRMGLAPLSDWTQRFGFSQSTGIDLPFEKQGSIPGSNRPPGESADSQRRFEQEALGLAIGQSRLTVTPVQMVRTMAAIANGGWLVTPHVVSQEGVAHTAADADSDQPAPTRVRIPGLREETLQHIREGLTATVEEPYGTAFRTVRLREVAIAGKTGTAETGAGQPDHAWFTGYVPADDPELAFVVVLEHGGSGSHTAGPVARELVRQIWKLNLLD